MPVRVVACVIMFMIMVLIVAVIMIVPGDTATVRVSTIEAHRRMFNAEMITQFFFHPLR